MKGESQIRYAVISRPRLASSSPQSAPFTNEPSASVIAIPPLTGVFLILCSILFPMHDDRTPQVEGHDGLMWVRGSGICRDWNGIRYKLGMSGRNVGATQLSMNVATIPPGGVAGAHIHVGFEVMLYILEGRVRHEYGDGLTERVDHEAGDFIFIAPGVPHEVFNLSDSEPVVAVVARSTPDEWDRIVPYVRPRGAPEA